MFAARWRLFSLFGIPVYVDASWLIIFVLVTWTLASAFFPQVLPDVPVFQRWTLGVVTALAFFLCIVLHEMGHALVARSMGIPMRGITLFMFGGVAELGGEPVSAGREFFMAIAGPIVSAVLAAGFWGLAALSAALNLGDQLTVVFNYLAWINGIVLFFNMVPAFPLDGGRVFRSILWAITGNIRRATHWASLAGQAFAWFLIGLGILSVLQDRDNWPQAVWFGLIGLFLNNAAKVSYQQVLIRQALQGEPVSHFMNTNPIVVPPSLDLRHWVEDFVYRYHRKAFPVASNGHLEGFVNTGALAKFPREEWDRHTVGEVMLHDIRPVTISPDADALHAFTKMQRTGSSRLLVAAGDQLLGIVSLKDLLRFLHLKIDLEDMKE